MDSALIGVIAASVIIFIVATVAIVFTYCYCQSMLKKKKEAKTTRRFPEEYSTVSTVAAQYSSVSYPGTWYYTDSYYYQQPKRLTMYRPKVISEDDLEPPGTERRKVKTEGHAIRGIDHKVLRKSQKRLADWLNANYDENSMSMVIGAEDDDRRESLTAEQFLAQNIRSTGRHNNNSNSSSDNNNHQNHRPTTDNNDEFTIVDYVDNDDRRRKISQPVDPQMFERKPIPPSPASLPYIHKSTIEVFQDKTASQLESLDGDGDDLYPASTSSPANSNQGTSPFNPIVLEGEVPTNDSFGFDHDNDTRFERGHYRQRSARIGSVENLPPEETDNYREFMTSRMTNYR